jgi:hypothetical protein
MSTATVLVMKIGEHDFMHRLFEPDLFEQLRGHSEITLASPHPVGTAEGTQRIGADGNIRVVLIIGPESKIPPVAAAIRDLRTDIHVVALEIERGTAILSLREPNIDELITFIRSLTESEPALPDQFQSGHILRFRTRLRAPPSATSSRTLPVPIESHGDPKIHESIEAALSWAEMATRNLITAWSGKGEEAPGFALSWEALERWLAEFARLAHTPAGPIEKAFRELLRKLDDDAFEQTPLAQIVRLIRADEIAVKLLLIVLAADLDIRFQRLFGALHDDLGRRYPSVGLACAILAGATDEATPATIRSEIAALDRLRKLGLIRGVGRTIAAADEPLRIEPQYLDWLLTGDQERLTGYDETGLLRARPDSAIALLSAVRLREVRRAVRRSLVGRQEVAAVLLTGSVPGWIGAEVGALAGPEFRIGPPPSDVGVPALETVLRSFVVASRITGRRLVVDMMREDTASDSLWRALAPILGDFEPPPYLITTNAARLLALTPNDSIVMASLPAPSIQDRRDAIGAALAAYEARDSSVIDTIADRFQIALEAIPDAVSIAASVAAQNGRPTRPEEKDWLAGFRRVVGSRLPRLARRIEPRPSPEKDAEKAPFSCLDVVILPQQQRDQLRSIVEHVRFGCKVLDDWGFGALLDAKGVATLFIGESGTGKTMAAHAIASELATDLYVIDLAQIVSKYIGETEKNLDTVFDEAERAGAVLLFDEADALFGKRSAIKDAHDRYANIEVAYLLQRMQQFAGLAILTSNHPENIDPAFTRRLRFNITFPRPSAADRLRIWEQSIPASLRIEPLNLKRLAFALDIPGATIRQMALHAAVFAAKAETMIGFGHVLAGARSELIRLGLYGDLPKLDALAADAQQARAA